MATGSNSTANVSLGKGVQGGYLYVAPYGTSLPTDYSSELSSEWTCLGYITEDGVTETPEESTTEVFDRNGDTILEEQATSKRTIHTALAETKLATLQEYFGDDCVTDEDGVITVMEVSGKHVIKSYVHDMLFSGDRHYRLVIPKGLVTEVDEVTYSSGDVVSWGTTMTELPDDSGVRSYRYIESTETSAE